MDERLLDVNPHGVLRVPAIMWLAFLTLARHWIWFWFMLLSAQYGGETGGGFSWWPMVAQAPAILMILAAGRRLPQASLLIRRTWGHGHVLVALTAFLNGCWTIWSLVESSQWNTRPELILVCGSMLDAAIAWGFWSSPYIRQIFAEFPARDSDVSASV